MTLKWSDIARMALPALIFVPGMGPFIGPILTGIGEADALFQPGDNDQKHDHVVTIVKTTATALKAAGVAAPDPDTAVDITEDVFKVIDQLKDTVKEAPTQGTHLDVVPVPGSKG